MPRPAKPARDYWTNLCRSRYLDPAAAVAYVEGVVDANPLVQARKRLDRVRALLGTARDPRQRFGLSQADINPAVIARLEAMEAEFAHVDEAVVALALRHRSLEAKGCAQDEVWDELEDEAAPLGFGYGSSSTLRAIASRVE